MQLSTSSSAQVADTGSCVVIGQDVRGLGSVKSGWDVLADQDVLH